MSDRKSRSFLIRAILLIGVPAIAIAIGGYFYLIGGRFVTTENAYVKADILQISADVEGRVTEVAVKDHQRVKQGDLLFRIDSAPIEIAVARARAEMGMVYTEVETMRAQYEEAKSALGEIDARIAYLERQTARQETLRKRGVTSRDALDKVTSDLAVERQKRVAAQQTMHRLLTALGGDANMDAREHPMYKEKVTMLRDARLDLERSAVYAPTNGIITNMKLQTGEYVESGKPVFSLISTGQPWVEANLKETDLTHVKVGQEATVVVDAYPDKMFTATVESISPATGAEFAVLPPQNATGNWVKVVQRLPVKLRIVDDHDEATPLRAGMTVSISIDTKHKRSSLVALERTFGTNALAAAD
ncbi:MAG: HlyD family secretion protein [Alphaproteobacteria bacterium]|nr:HlyD family secretion protein [Alphaproteobacteria bacterium]MCB9929736.1 HlyD family secretion protein [Alphaproteobacteria bacterium]